MSYYSRKEKPISINEHFVEKLIEWKMEDYLKEVESYTPTYRDKHFTYNVFLNHMLGSIQEPGFEVRWCLGGKHGNYSGDYMSVSSEPEVDMEDLDKFLLKYYSNIGFLQYKVITHKIDKTTDSEGDYYGGNVDYGVKSLTYGALADSLVEFGYLSSGKKLDKDGIKQLISEKYTKDWFNDKFPTKTEAKKLKK